MITRDMTIEEILMSFPQKSQKLAQAITKKGLHCAGGCSAASWETLEAGMLGHGKTEEEITELLAELNEILLKPWDNTTIGLTERAAAKIQEILVEVGKEGWALRFGDEPGGCSGFEYVLDFSEKPTENDEVFQSHGVEIHVDKNSLGRLLGSEIDYSEGLMDAGFKIINPNVRNSCGCGNSQSY